MKSTVRNNILIKLNSLSRDEKKRQSEHIQNQLHSVLKNESGSWAAYINLKDEPEIRWNEVSSQIDWAFPKLENNEIEFRRAVQNFKKSSLGFSEPEDGEKIGLEQIKGIVVPALAYDLDGHRLGRGKGFYDRALAGFTGQKIGVCFNVSLCEELPREGHDIKCDQIVTENQIYQVNKPEGVRKWN